MNFVIGYGMILLFFVVVIYIMERNHRETDNFEEFSVAGRSFGSWFQTMAFLNTWLPGTIFIAFAGLAASAGVIGYYVISYSLLAVLFMYYLADRVFDWGKRHNLKTQSDFVGMRYNSDAVRVTAAIIGVVSMFPWIILGLQSLGLVFSYLSFGYVSPEQAVFVSIAVLAIRQYWTVRLGMRGIVISDMVQGIIAYGVGGLLSIGFIVMLLRSEHGFGQLAESFAALPSFGSDLGPLYYFSIVLTGALGSWCWPDIFVRLFTAKSAQTVRNSAFKAAPLMFLFLALMLTAAMLASSMPEVAAAPDNVWFLLASHGGPVILSIAGICVLAATMGNINALTQATGVHAAQDIFHVKGGTDRQITRTARIIVGITTILAIIGAIMTVNTTAGLLTLALAAYQGIVQLAPSLYLGLLWKRPTASAAVLGMIVGFVVAVVLQFLYPVSIPALGGLTSGVVGLICNTVVLVAVTLLTPAKSIETQRVAALFA
ncbi:MAG TPA: sodium:solute symporter family protein [Geminicoccus sp.]|uniref:sodium:solute symporter family protein n=1 Tax=Geminicoccus sp. TaxID=2024832 RepID=UPI002BB40C44|nr:sodium:solute symporter family protein [Geminicoccus sp.]HWL71571.1 sodium:solute symporter family protein [Geminicoccus sp.]